MMSSMDGHNCSIWKRFCDIDLSTKTKDVKNLLTFFLSVYFFHCLSMALQRNFLQTSLFCEQICNYIAENWNMYEYFVASSHSFQIIESICCNKKVGLQLTLGDKKVTYRIFKFISFCLPV